MREKDARDVNLKDRLGWVHDPHYSDLCRQALARIDELEWVLSALVLGR